MKAAFEPTRDGIRWTLRPEEAELLARMSSELRSILAGSDEDPVNQRLFPRTVSEDDEADSELRSMIHAEMHEQKFSALDQLDDLLERADRDRGRLVLELVEEEPAVVLGTLNDIRVAIASRVGIEVVESRDAPDEDTEHALAVMDWFAMWQEQLLAALDPESARHYETGHELEE